MENHLIELLPPQDRSRLLAIGEQVSLEVNDTLCQQGLPLPYVHFPTGSRISVQVALQGHASLEVGMIGVEGMLGAHLALGVSTVPLDALVRGAGLSWRMSTRAFQEELRRSPALQRSLARYMYVLMAQLASAVACAHFHQIGPRLARWLLMSQDRVLTDQFHVTHEGLAQMLGVRRVGVTSAASTLQREGLISYHRGHVTVLNRLGLEAMACSCYQSERHVYAAVL